MQVADQRADAIGRVLLGFADLLELLARLHEVALVEQLARDVHLDREPEEHLGEVVVEVRRDLLPLVGTFLRHRVRERAQDLLAILELL